MAGLHTGSIWKDFVPGEIGYRPGGIMACMDRSRSSSGKGVPRRLPPWLGGHHLHRRADHHGAPDNREPGSGPLEPTVVSLGEIHAGTAFNIIPGECRITGTVRALNQATREFLARRIEEVASGVASSMRGSIEFKYGWEGPAPVVNDPAMTEELRLAAEKIVGPEKVREISVLPWEEKTSPSSWRKPGDVLLPARLQ